jgi:hypothetical protein
MMKIEVARYGIFFGTGFPRVDILDPKFNGDVFQCNTVKVPCNAEFAILLQTIFLLLKHIPVED